MIFLAHNNNVAVLLPIYQTRVLIKLCRMFDEKKFHFDCDNYNVSNTTIFSVHYVANYSNWGTSSMSLFLYAASKFFIS